MAMNNGKEAPAEGGAAPHATDENEMDFVDDLHVVSCFQRFEEIRRKAKLCDVTLDVNGRKISAHRLVLAAVIPYFYGMFLNEMVESFCREVAIKDADPDAMDALVSFAYTGRLKINTANVQALFVTSSFLQMTNVFSACCDFLANRLRLANVLALKELAKTFACQRLIDACDRYVDSHFIEVANSDQFMAAPFEDVRSILSRDELFVKHEETVYCAAMKWVRNDPINRADHLPELLKCVRLSLLKADFLSDEVLTDDLVASSPECVRTLSAFLSQRKDSTCFVSRPRNCDHMVKALYALGALSSTGEPLPVIERFDPFLNRWCQDRLLPSPRTRVGVASLRNRLYVIGGFSGFERLTLVESLDTETNEWKTDAPLCCRRSAYSAVSLDDRIYALGGYDGFTSLSSCERYDTIVDRWSLISPMHTARSAAGAAALDGKVFIFGGHDCTCIFNSCECYNVAADRWAFIKQMHTRRCRLGAAALNGSVYCAGGYDGSRFLNSVERYEPARDEWFPVSNLRVSRSRVALVSTYGKLYAIGGYDGLTNLSSVEVYDSATDSWEFGPSLHCLEGGFAVAVMPVVVTSD